MYAEYAGGEYRLAEVNIAEANTTGASMAGIVNFCNVETMLPPSRRFLALADWVKGREVSANFRLFEWEHIRTHITCTDTSGCS